MNEGAVLRAVDGLHVGGKHMPLVGFHLGHGRPADGLGVFEDTGLDGLVFGGGGHHIEK